MCEFPYLFFSFRGSIVRKIFNKSKYELKTTRFLDDVNLYGENLLRDMKGTKIT